MSDRHDAGSVLHLWPSEIAVAEIEIVRLPRVGPTSEFRPNDLIELRPTIESIDLIAQAYAREMRLDSLSIARCKLFTSKLTESDPCLPLAEPHDIHALVCTLAIASSASSVPSLYLYDPRVATTASATAAGPSSKTIRFDLKVGFCLVFPAHIRWCSSPLWNGSAIHLIHCTYAFA